MEIHTHTRGLRSLQDQRLDPVTANEGSEHEGHDPGMALENESL